MAADPTPASSASPDAPAAPPRRPQQPRIVARAGDKSRPIVRVGLPRAIGDLYHLLLTTTWPRLFAIVLALYAALNAVFALAYLLAGADAVENARPGNFVDAFFFSVQTMATIGYGKMVPRSLFANVLVSVEALFGLLGTAMATGLMFAKFARPTARVLFSGVAVIAKRDGVESLMFRMANARANQIVEATVHVVMAKNEVTAEGEKVRRFYDLKPSRASSALFTLTWTAIVPLTPDSPLYGLDADAMRAAEVEILVSLTGLDETFSQTIHARYSYVADELRWGERFADVLSTRADGARVVDFGRFHDTIAQ